MKTIIARFTELKKNIAGTDKSEFEDLDYNKVDTALKSVGVSLKDTNGQFRDLDDVFLELSGKWNTLDRNSQRYIATIAAGSRQQSRFIAMMENYERTVELVETAQNSAGKSSEQFAKYQDTLEYKIKQLSNSWEQLRTNFFNSDVYKGAIDFLTGILDKIKEFDVIDVAALGTTWLTLGKNVIQNFIQGIQKNVTGLQKVFSTISEKISSKISIKPSVKINEERINALKQKLIDIEREKVDITVDDQEALANLQKIQAKMDELQVKGEEGFEIAAEKVGIADEALGNASRLNELNQREDTTRDTLNNEQLQKEQAEARGQAIGQALAASITAAVTAITMEQDPGEAFVSIFGAGIMSALPMVIQPFITALNANITNGVGTAIKAALSAIGPVTGIILGITVAIAGITAGIAHFNKKAKDKTLEVRLSKAKERADELTQSVSELNAELNNTKEKIEGLKDVENNFIDLTNKNIRTDEEQAQYEDFVEKIKSDYPEIISFYNSETNVLQVNNSLLENKIALLEREKELQNNKLIKEKGLLAIANYEVNSLKSIAEITSDLNFKGQDLTISDNRDLEAFIRGNSKIVEGDLEIDESDIITTPGKILFADRSKQIGDKSISRQSISSMIGLEDTVLSMDLAEETYESIIKSETDLADLAAKIYQETGQNTAEIEKKLSDVQGIVKQASIVIEQNLKALEAEIEAAATSYFETTNLTETGKSVGIALSGSMTEQISRLINEVNIQDDEDEDIINYATNLNQIANELVGNSLKVTEQELKQVMEEVTEGADGLVWNTEDDWKQLSEEVQAAFKKMGITNAEEYSKFVEEGGLGDEEALQKIKDLYIETVQESFYEVAEEIATEYSDNIEKLLKEEENITAEQYINQAQQILKDFTESDAYLALPEDTAKTMVASFKEMLQIPSLTKAEGALANVNNAMQLSTNSLLSLSKKMAQYRDSTRQEIENVLNAQELTAEELDVVSQINWDGEITDLIHDSQTYIDAFVESGMNVQEATGKFNDITQKLVQAIGNYINTSQGFDLLLSDMYSSYSEDGFGVEPYFSAYEQIMEKGTINAETIAKNRELFGEDLIFKDGNAILSEDVNEKILNLFSKDFSDLGLQAQQTTNIVNDSSLWDSNLQSIAEAYKTNLENLSQEGLDAWLKENTKNYNETQLKWINQMISSDDSLEDIRDSSKDAAITGFENAIEAAEFSKIAYQEQLIDLKEKEIDLNKEIADLEEEITEAEKARYEAEFGTKYWQVSSDALYNYEQQLTKVADKIEKIKEDLEDSESLASSKQNINELMGVIEEQSLLRAAQSSAIDNYLSENLTVLEQYSQKYGSFFSKNEDGSLNLDFEALENIKASDKIRTGLENLLTERNEYIQKKKDLIKEEEEQEKEFIELREKFLDEYVSVQEGIADILEKQAQDEIDTLKEKYDTLKEMDNDYLSALEDAINKQRELRDRENAYEDLAQQRKKLSLMQRDTSGVNKKEQLELQQQIEESEQNLLDSEVDNLINGMKELYESQQEQRDALIENKEAVIENTDYLKQASLIQNTFQTQDDYIAWQMENNPEVDDMSPEKLESMINTWKEEYANMANYINLEKVNITDAMQHTQEEILDKAATISTGLKNQATLTMEEIEVEVSEDIQNAQDKLDDANEKLTETNKQLETLKGSISTLNDLSKEYMEYVDKQIVFLQEQIQQIKNLPLKEQGLQSVFDANIKNQINNIKNNNNLSGNEKAEALGALRSNFIKLAGAENQELAEKIWDDNIFPKNMNTTATTTISMTPDELLSKYPGEYFIGDSAFENEYLNNNSIAAGVTGYQILIQPEKDNGNKGYVYTFNKGLAESAQNSGFKVNQQNAAGEGDSDPSNIFKGNKWEPTQFATGGLVNYTGPAWVDGTPTKPEAFLSAADTERIGNAAKLLATLPIFNPTNTQSNLSSNIGDTSIEIHINVESLASDYDVDQMIERVKNDIIDVSKPTGTSVFLHK